MHDAPRRDPQDAERSDSQDAERRTTKLRCQSGQLPAASVNHQDVSPSAQRRVQAIKATPLRQGFSRDRRCGRSGNPGLSARSTVNGKRGAEPQDAQRGGGEFAGSWESNVRIPDA